MEMLPPNFGPNFPHRDTATFLIEKLPNFGYMTTSTMQFESRDKILLVTSWTEIMAS